MKQDKTQLNDGWVRTGYQNGGKIYFLREKNLFCAADNSGWLPRLYATLSAAERALKIFRSDRWIEFYTQMEELLIIDDEFIDKFITP